MIYINMAVYRGQLKIHEINSDVVSGGRGQILWACLKRSCGPIDFLYNGKVFSYPGVKRSGRGVEQFLHKVTRLKIE